MVVVAISFRHVAYQRADGDKAEDIADDIAGRGYSSLVQVTSAPFAGPETNTVHVWLQGTEIDAAGWRGTSLGCVGFEEVDGDINGSDRQLCRNIWSCCRIRLIQLNICRLGWTAWWQWNWRFVNRIMLCTGLQEPKVEWSKGCKALVVWGGEIMCECKNQERAIRSRGTREKRSR